MSRLYLECALCGRKQAEGLLSRAAWGHAETSEGQTLRACPTCKTAHSDWEQRLLVGVRGDARDGNRFGGVYR